MLETKISLGKKVEILTGGKLPTMALRLVFLDQEKCAGKERPAENAVREPSVRHNQVGENLSDPWLLEKHHHTNLNEVITYSFLPVVRS